jgi:hypothetical protein
VAFWHAHPSTAPPAAAVEQGPDPNAGTALNREDFLLPYYCQFKSFLATDLGLKNPAVKRRPQYWAALNSLGEFNRLEGQNQRDE